MSITHGIVNDICIVDFITNFTWNLRDSIKSYIMDLMEDESVKGIVINFERVQFIDSQLLGLLVSLYKQAQMKKLKFALCRLNRSNLELLKISRLHEIINIYPTEEEALEDLIDLKY